MAPPNPPSPVRKKKLSKGAIAGIVCGSILVVFLLVWFLVVPRIVAGKVRDEADRRALAIDFSLPTLGFSQVTLRSVVVTPKSNAQALKIEAPTMHADLSGFSPTYIHLDSATISLVGSPQRVNEALADFRAADAKIPAAEKLPIEVLAGTMQWKEPLGAGTSLKFDALHAALDPRVDFADITLQNGTLNLSSMTLAPLEVHTKLQKNKVHVSGTLAKDAATFDLSRASDGDTFDLTLSGLHPKDFDAGIPGLDLSKASIDGEISYERDADDAASSKGDVSATKLKLPPISVGPISIALGTSVRVKWKASPKKGSKGVMKIESGTVTIAILGTTRTVTFGGELHLGEDGTGPFKGTIDWTTETLDCATISPIKGVTGTIGASGTLTFDLADLGGARIHPKIDMNCDVAGGLGNLLNQIP
jgi:hypothetical protein